MINCWAENQHHGQAEERQRPVNNVHFDAVPSLNSDIPNHLCSNVVYHITCPGCTNTSSVFLLSIMRARRKSSQGNTCYELLLNIKELTLISRVTEIPPGNDYFS